ncbi:hypothetical protein CEP48_00375 [Mergibacter septicus]|uniref:Uncharacterized protein n=1 Tax=Mergibacter septicus TaxID=221402 RepID=A0A8E3MEX6_9PAST|nr:hypothetical protein [Mergibacter septicus]AWX14736.1 hypothetical protein CEP47_00375 [Mergibacter septicus]QDJ13987.1 hypothetical protein CEP48_00375 [Mergibacter septicus]UTU48564.1 hypothetical protein HLL31_07255 [Mergibacter septicus]WMR95807.1 hypothetical protein RDJ12_07745 [Mergibacter septicus]
MTRSINLNDDIQNAVEFVEFDENNFNRIDLLDQYQNKKSRFYKMGYKLGSILSKLKDSMKESAMVHLGVDEHICNIVEQIQHELELTYENQYKEKQREIKLQYLRICISVSIITFIFGIVVNNYLIH